MKVKVTEEKVSQVAYMHSILQEITKDLDASQKETFYRALVSSLLKVVDELRPNASIDALSACAKVAKSIVSLGKFTEITVVAEDEPPVQKRFERFKRF